MHGKQCMQCGRLMRCGLVGFFQSEQRHYQDDITPSANEGSGVGTLPLLLRCSRVFVSRSEWLHGLDNQVPRRAHVM